LTSQSGCNLVSDSEWSLPFPEALVGANNSCHSARSWSQEQESRIPPVNGAVFFVGGEEGKIDYVEAIMGK
jgi:hypothetical protein